MAKNNAARQAAYRERHLHDVDGEGARLNTIVSSTTKLALERLAICYGVTQRVVLERMIADAQRVAIDQAATKPNGQQAYYDGHLRLYAWHTVTP